MKSSKKVKKIQLDNFPIMIIPEKLDELHNVHHCPFCLNYLWADENHMSYNHCCYCGRSLKGIQLPYERI